MSVFDQDDPPVGMDEWATLDAEAMDDPERDEDPEPEPTPPFPDPCPPLPDTAVMANILCRHNLLGDYYERADAVLADIRDWQRDRDDYDPTPDNPPGGRL